MTIKRIILVTLGIIVVLVVAIISIAHLPSFQQRVAERVIGTIEAKACLAVEIESFEYRLWPAALAIRGIIVSDSSGRTLSIEAVEASWAWSQLVGQTPRLRSLAIKELQADAFRLPLPCPGDEDKGESDPWTAVAFDTLTLSRAGVFGENVDLAFSWTGLEAQASLVDQQLDLHVTATNLALVRDDRNLSVGPVEIDVQGTPSTIQLETLKITGGPVQCQATGSIDGHGHAASTKVSGTVDLREILHWWDPPMADLLTPKGILELDADLGWNADTGVRALARLDGRPFDVAGFTISQLEMSYANDRLSATAADPSWGQAEVDMGSNGPVEITATLADMNPAPALTLAGVDRPAVFPADLAISGDLQARISLPVQIDQIKGKTNLVARWKGGGARLRARADNGIAVDLAEIEVFQARAEASGTIALDGTLDIDCTVALPDPGKTVDQLATSHPELGIPVVGGGPLNTTLRLTGPITAPNIQSDIRWDTPEIEGNHLEEVFATARGNADHLDWTATLKAGAGRLHASGTASPRSASVVSEWRLDSLDLAALDLRSVMAEEPEIEGSIEGRGTLQIDPGNWRVSAHIEGQEIHSPLISIHRLILDAEADPACVSINTLAADILGGHVEGTGRLCPVGLDGEVQAAFQWSNLDPSHLFEQFPTERIGRISGQLGLKGPLSDPNGSAQVSLEMTPDEAPFDSGTLLAHLEDGTVTVVSDRLNSISGPLTLRASLPMGNVPRPEGLFATAPRGEWKLRIEGHDLALAPLIESLDQEHLIRRGSSDLDIRASWLPDSGKLPQVQLELDKFEMTVADQRITAPQPIRLALDDRGVVAAEITLEGDLNSIVMGGSYDLKKSEIDASIHGSLDPNLALLSPIPLTINQPITLNGRLTGPAGAWVGHFNLDHEGGSIEMRDPPLEITDAAVEAQWSDRGLEISDGSALVNRGTVMLGGGWDPESGQGIVAELEDVTALLPGGIVTRWDGAIAIEPASDHLMEIVGDLNLKYGVWDYPFDLGAAVRGGSDDAVPGADDISHNIGLDMEVRGGGGIAVDNNLGRFGVRWNILTIGGTAAQPQIVGDLNLLPGGVLTAAGQPITIRRGLVQFTGDPLTDPLLEVIPEDRGRWNTGESGSSKANSQNQVSSMAAAGLASGIGAVFGMENTMIRPEEIALETDEDTSTDFSIGQQLSHNTALFLTTDLRNSQKRTTLLQLWRLPSFPGLTLQAMTKTDPGEADAKLLQRFSWGGTRATGAQPRLHKVQLEGEWPWSKRKLRRATALVRDQPWDPFFLFLGDIRLEKKLTGQGWPEARVDSRLEGTPERPIAVFTCTPGRKVEFTFEGDSLGKAFRSSLRPLYRFPPLEQAALAEMHRSAMRHLWAAGHPDATVSITSDSEGEVTVSINKGPETTLSGPVLEGVSETAGRPLTALLSQPTELTEISRDPTRAERVVRRTLAAYGYRDVRSVESWTETKTDGVVEVHIRIDPGAQSRAVRVDLVGDDPLGLSDAQDFAIRSNMILERGIIDDAVASLRHTYRKEGYTQVRVRAQIYEFDDHQWAVLLTLDPGSTATVDRVEISGRRYLSEKAVVNHLPIQPGNQFLLDDLDDSVANLATFEPVERVTATTRSEADRVVVDLDIIEKPRWTGEIGGGWNSDRGATARAGINDNNLFGRGFRLGLRGRAEQDFLQGRIMLALPPLPGGRFSATLTGSYTEDVLPAEFEGDIVINEQIREASLEGHYRLKAGLWTRGYYRWTRTRTFEADPFDPDFPLDITRDLAVLGTQIVVDRLDNPFDPRRGHSLALDLSWAGDAIGSDTENIRSLLTGSLASEPFDGWTWFQSIRLGAARPLNGVLDRQSRFFAGGSASIRGFELDSVGPTETLGGITIYAGGEALFVLNEELRFPLWQSLRGAVFVDSGQVWKTWSDASFDLSVGAGVGLRWSTPVGPLWVDAAWPIANRGENSGARYSFGIGRTF